MKTIRFLILLVLLIGSGVSAQNVGINDDGSSPHASAMLDVKSFSKGFLAPRMTVEQRDGIVSPATGLMVYQTNGTAGYYYYTGSAWTQIGLASGATQWNNSGSNVYYNTGNVGIGTNNPGHKLTAEGIGTSNTGVLGIDVTGNAAFTWASSAIAPNLSAGNSIIHMLGQAENEYNSGYIGFHFIESGSSDNFLTFGLHSHDNLLSLTGAGNVGIGTTSPSARLHLSAGAGNAAIKIDNTAYLEFGAGVSGKETNAGKIAYQLFTTDALDIVGAGTPVVSDRKIKFWAEGGSYFTGRIDVAGGAYCNGTNWVNASDARLKRDIQPMTNYGLAQVLQLKPVTYYYRADKTNHHEVGFIAQDVQKIIPEVVSGSEGDLQKGETLGLSYDNLVPLLTKAIQEQQAIIEDQQKQIDNLGKLVNQLMYKN